MAVRLCQPPGRLVKPSTAHRRNGLVWMTINLSESAKRLLLHLPNSFPRDI
jgi:hypothetical protein